MDSISDAPGAAAARAGRTLALFLFLTGATALVYQVVWTRHLALLLGSSAVAVVVVLAAFMGGLAIGNLIFGGLADRPISRLRLYGWLELGVGAYCILFPGLLELLSRPYQALVVGLSATQPGLFTAVRLALAAALLLPPTILMGGTLPVATRFLVGLAPGVRAAVGRLYWINSAGAVAGALLAGFFLVPTLGLDLSLDLAGLVNVAVATAALALRHRLEGTTPGDAIPAPEEPPLPDRAAWAALAAVTLSGFAGLGLEVAWTRLLAMVVGGSTYAFTLMVATFILGIALGSRAAASARLGRGDPATWLGGALALVAVMLAVSLPAYPRLPWLFQWLRGLLSSSPDAFPLYQALLFLVAALVMLVPTVAMGATLPLAARLAARGPAVGRRVGLTWALNTLGTLAGVLLSGLVLLPRLGLQRTFALMVCCYAVAALAALLGSGRSARRPAVAVAVVAALALPSAWLQADWDPAMLAAGTFRLRVTPDPLSRWAESLGMRSRWHRDGATATVDVVDYTWGERSLKVNGKTDASLTSDLDTQVLLGHIPAVLAPASARRALVIGVGSGATVAALAAHPALDVTAVEIEPAVLEAAREHFKGVNEGVLDGHPRVHVLVEDAKTVFQRGGEPYDLVVSEPSNPWLAGIGGLFSQEYFTTVRSRLAPDGVMAQWLQTYELDDETVRLVLRTFASVFPEVTVWQPQPKDYVLLGSNRPIRLDPELLARRLAEPAVRRSLARAEVDSVEGLLARQVLSPGGVVALAGMGAVNTDQLPLLEFAAPRSLFTGQDAQLFVEDDERPSPLGRGGLLLHAWLPEHPSVTALTSMARSVERSLPSLGLSLRALAAGAAPGQAEPALALARAAEARSNHALALQAVASAPPGQERDHLRARAQFSAAVDACQVLRNGVVRRPECPEAMRLGLALLEGPTSPEEQLATEERLARIELWTGADAAALARYRALLARPLPPERRHEAEWRTGEAAALLRLGDAQGAAAAAQRALQLDPRNKLGVRLLRAALQPDRGT